MLVTGLDPDIIPEGKRDRRIETCSDSMNFVPVLSKTPTITEKIESMNLG